MREARECLTTHQSVFEAYEEAMEEQLDRRFKGLRDVQERKIRVNCHRYDFLVCVYGTDLLFLNFLNFILHLGLITTPHVLYVHMTYVYSFPHVSFFTRSHGQEKSLSYYDLLHDFGVLFYGRIFTLISFYFLHNPTTPILPVYVDQRRPHLEKDTTRPRSVVIRKIPTVPRRTLVTPH